MKTRWHIRKPDPQSVHELCNALNCSPVIASILINRNITTTESAMRFLNGSIDQLRPPFAIKDMNTAVQRIIQAITGNETILIFGDYDADGITATTLLLDFLNTTGVNVFYYIPHRTREGYSLQIDHINRIASPKGTTLIITVDCGSDSHAAITAAGQAGINVIVTDHHNVSGQLPPAVAVVNPKRLDCTAGFEDLSGAGTAFFLIVSLRTQLRNMGFWKDRPEPNLKQLCDLVALGTVADIVPLFDENRLLTQLGLAEINQGNRPGIKALIQASGISGRQVDAEDIAFRLAPRLNAAGRMDHADTAIQLLTEKNPAQALALAKRLNYLNSNRQKAENELFEQVLSDINRNPEHIRKHSLVLSYEECHEGILGIVAARLVRRFHRPVVLISTKEGQGKGSARSIPGFDLYRGLVSCSEKIERFGGHKMAAGITLREDHIDGFRECFENIVKQMTTPDDFIQKVFVDYELSLDTISDTLLDELEALKPFGSGNPEPVFMARDVTISSSKIVGKNHRRMLLRSSSNSSNRQFNAIQFNIDPDKPLKDHYENILFRLGWNYWNGNKTAQITIEDM